MSCSASPTTSVTLCLPAHDGQQRSLVAASQRCLCERVRTVQFGGQQPYQKGHQSERPKTPHSIERGVFLLIPVSLPDCAP